MKVARRHFAIDDTVAACKRYRRSYSNAKPAFTAKRPLVRRANTVRSIQSWRQPTRGYRLQLSADDGSGKLKGIAPLAPASAPSRAQTE